MADADTLIADPLAVDRATAPVGTFSPATDNARIVRHVLYDAVIQKLREMIYAGELAPGTHVSERRLCEQFDISRTPLREALKVLASEGLIELLPNRGAVVTRLSATDVEHMFQVMGALEALVGEIAATRIQPDALDTLQALHDAMVRCYQAGDRASYFQLNQMIHSKIVEASGNTVLINLYNNLSGRIRRARFMTTLANARWDQAVDEHAQMISALRTQDGESLGRILKNHLKLESLKAHLG